MSAGLEEGLRTVAADVHDIDDVKHQVAVDYPIEVDTYKTDFGHRCFEDGWRRQLPAMVEDHDTKRLIGHAVSAESLPNVHRIVNQFSDFDDVPNARAAFAHIRDKDYPGFSFHYIQGKTVAHPNIRGARRFVQARMLENGPVLYPSITGAVATGLRTEVTAMAIPTLEQIIEMSKTGMLDEDGVRALVAEHYPHLDGHFKIPEHITLTAGQRSDVAPSIDSLTSLHTKGMLTDAGFRAAMATHYPDIPLAKTKLVGENGIDQAALKGVRTAMSEVLSQYDAEGFRSLTITIGDDGSVSTDGGGAQSTDDTVTNDGESDTTTLVQAIDAALDHANASIGDMDTTALPDNVQQAISLMNAAGIAVDELQDVLGIEDPDDPLETDQRSEAEMDLEDETAGTRAILGTKDRNALPDSAFAYVEKGGTKDDEGKTTPRTLRHFPLKKDVADDAPLDPDHVRNALSRIGAGAAFSDEAKPKVLAAAKKLKIAVADDGHTVLDGKRSTDEVADSLRERFGIDADAE